MSLTLHVLALVVAVVSIPTVAGLTAWGLAGGDGSTDNALIGVLGALVGFGSLYVAVTCWTAFWGLPEWRWWLMLVPPIAGLLGLALASRDHVTMTSARDNALDTAIGVAMQLVLAAPALLLWGAGLVAPA